MYNVELLWDRLKPEKETYICESVEVDLYTITCALKDCTRMIYKGALISAKIDGEVVYTKEDKSDVD